MDRRGVWRRGAAAVAVLVLSGSACSSDRPGATVPSPDAAPGREEAQAFLDAWGRDDVPAAAALTTDATGPVVAELDAVVEDLRVRSATFVVNDVVRIGPDSPFAVPGAPGPAATAPATIPPGDRVEVAFDATLQIGGLGPWSYTGRLPMVVTAAGPRVVWTPAAVHPVLQPGQRLARTRTRPERAAIVGADGAPLVGARPAVDVGVVPGRVQDIDALAATLSDSLGVDAARVKADVTAPNVKPDWFIPVTTISREEYQVVKPVIYDLPGTSFKEGDRRMPPSPGFGRHVLGRTGEITAELLGSLGITYQVGDVVGFTGIEGAYERQLAGEPSGAITVVGPDGTVVSTLHTVAGVRPRPVTTTIVAGAQEAAEQALEGVTEPAAIVAVNEDGEVVAAVSRPLSDDFHRAFLGSYPPGSTFKLITAEALLEAGTTPDTPVSCPATTNVGGREFHNFEGEQAGALTFAQAFAVSCNTAMIDRSRQLPPGALAAAAARFGFGADYDTGLVSKGGAFPESADDAEAAAAAIGQGRVTTSPLHLASVGAAVLRGRWTAPVLVQDSPTPAGAGAPSSAAEPSRSAAAETPSTAPAALPLDPGAVASLRTLLRGVVTSGTGTAAAVAGASVEGKTGTAEFGEGPTPPTHAWFVGLLGRVSVAVIVEGGGVGGEVAAPIAGRFLLRAPTS